MKLIIYAGSRLMTGDEVAGAVLDYCAALADADTAETVEIPILMDDGEPSKATLLVGPASQIVAQDVTSEWDELEDPDTVRLLKEKTRAHRPVASSHAQSDEDEGGTWTDDY
jgi:hypothetical protein